MLAANIVQRPARTPRPCSTITQQNNVVELVGYGDARIDELVTVANHSGAGCRFPDDREEFRMV